MFFIHPQRWFCTVNDIMVGIVTSLSSNGAWDCLCVYHLSQRLAVLTAVLINCSEIFFLPGMVVMVISSIKF